jgi:uncharacterized protein (TIGR02757 family)
LTDLALLKNCLDKLADEYGARFLDSDPVGLVHEYDSPEDREVAGFVISVLAYGGASQIRKSGREVLSYTGKSPEKFVRDLTPDDAIGTFRSFRHRWTDGGDIAYIFWVIGEILREFGSVGALVRSLDNPDEPTIDGVMTRFSAWVTERYSDRFRLNSSRDGISYLIPSPARGSACKRLALYFRWMVRGPDGTDFGLWQFISTARLVIPVDRHIARMAGLIGLTARRTADWKMVLEITESLRRIDPHDPVRYDFALVRPGILRQCTVLSKGDCPSCHLREICSEAV